MHHFRRQTAAATSPAEAIYPGLALSSILWWSDEKDEAVAELTKIVDAARPESDLRFDLAELLVQQGSPADALEVVDAVQPLDNLSLKRREELALGAAISAGNVERAQHAAERLFGLRLDTDTQIKIAGQMHQLGLHELAEAVLGRARRRAGGQAGVLVNLMLQYQRQDKPDHAAQIAIQVLRASRTGSSAPAGLIDAVESDAGRYRRHQDPGGLGPSQTAHRAPANRSRRPRIRSHFTSCSPIITRPPGKPARPSPR